MIDIDKARKYIDNSVKGVTFEPVMYEAVARVLAEYEAYLITLKPPITRSIFYEYVFETVKNINAYAIINGRAEKGWRAIGFDNDGNCWFEREKK